MILKRYGTRFQSVTTNFDPNAMNEIGFQKSDQQVIAADEFAANYEQTQLHELTAAAEGHVQGEAEEAVCAQLREQMQQLDSKLSDGEVLVVESEIGKDYPKMREKVSTLVVGGANRLHFQRSIEPPLRVAVYRPRQR